MRFRVGGLASGSLPVAMSQFHVNQIATRIRDLYEGSHWVAALDEANNLSRLLAVHAVDLVLGGLEAGGARTVELTDGAGDHGIDAVGVDPATKLIVFVQAKWRQDGAGSFLLADTLKLLDGVRSLLGMKTDAEPVHASAETRDAMHQLLRTPGARIRLVTATTGSSVPATEVMAPVHELLAQLNDLEGSDPLATHTHLDQAFFFDALTAQPTTSVDLDLQLHDWGRATDPLKVYYGRVSAAEIAEWYATHGADLFAENIRVVIPRSDISDGMLSTIQNEPERFGYYNNGITLLSGQIDVSPAGLLNKAAGFFHLKGASVVNGAQTVSTLGKVLGTVFEPNLALAFVMVRCIEVPPTDDQLARRITRFANTQNEVSSQDFTFLDQEQHRLVKELRSLGYEYSLRAGEIPKVDDLTKWIDVRQAAVALACADADLGLAVVAKREVSRLFSESVIYQRLFNPETDALTLLRAVLVTRVIDHYLDAIETGAEGLEAGVAIHAGRVIAHVVLRGIGEDALADPNVDLEAILVTLPDLIQGHVNALVDSFPENSYPGNVFKNQPRCVELMTDAGLLQ